MTIIQQNDKLRSMAEIVINDDRHSAAAHQLARGVVSLLHQLQHYEDVFTSVMDPKNAATMSGPGGKLYPITADGMRELIDLLATYRNMLKKLSSNLNHLRADIDGTLHPNSGMAQNLEQLL